MRKIMLFFAVSLVMISLSGQPAFAESGNTAADFLSEIAIRQYEKGDLEGAIHEFSKALLVDPNHEVSKAYLAKMGLSDGIYNKGRRGGTVADLARHIVSTQSQVVALEEEKGELSQELDNLRRDHEKYVSSTDQIRETRLMKELEIETLQARIKAQEMKIQEQMNQMGTDYETRKQYLEAKVALEKQELLRQQEELKQKMLAIAGAEPESLEAPPIRTKEIVMFRNVNSALGYEEQMAALSEDYNKARDEFSLEKAKNDHIIRVLEDYVYTRRGEIDQLENQLLHKDADFVNQEDILLARLDELVRVYRMLEKQVQLMKGLGPVLE